MSPRGVEAWLPGCDFLLSLTPCYVCRLQGVQPKGPAVPANHGMGYHHAQAEGGYAFFMPNGEKGHRV